ncbi:substrate-binding domain-containing protein [Oceanobacillus alkalisoli]|uniref:substrate-binding domain-containing protein n=1 Tax=Oceanobacillus alkalisoli TaxID=2925113 RepID=UPI001EF06070|nr:substrate-binding domain-containing protein [Oceanobacillus alkalisoli]MCF3944161.1 substrate-binding domain-containing protein [Oceanobacillus alkalisoli]MCG5102550.1 substrate-binding domain-containing protein [Oceanobacillus alkalisoli]
MKRLLIMLLALTSILVLAACGSGNDSTNGEGGSESGDTNFTGSIKINENISEEVEIKSEGPKGEVATSATSLELTEEEVKEIQEGDYTAAIAMHYAGNDWARAQIEGLEATFEKMGIEVLAVTDGQFSVEKQMADIETILARQPDILVSIPVDPVSSAGAYRQAVQEGVHVVFMDNVPEGFEPGDDYVSVVSADNYGNGVLAAEILAEELGEEGDIGVIYHDADFFVTGQRVEAFEKTIEENYPNINIQARNGIANPEDGESVASAMLTKDSDLDGMFVVWDVPAEGALAAIRSAGQDDMKVTTIDLGTNVAIDIAGEGNIVGLGAQLPYEQGVAEAILAGYSLLGKEAPSYVAVPATRVTRDNLLETWELVYNQEAPSEVKSKME